MRIDKFALWTAQPVVVPPKSSTQLLVDAIDSVANEIKIARGPLPTPGKTAFAVYASLGAVRDTLADAGRPTAAGTNKELDRHRGSAPVCRAQKFLDGKHAALGVAYAAQFDHLRGPGDLADPERIARLAALNALESRVLREVSGDTLI